MKPREWQCETLWKIWQTDQQQITIIADIHTCGYTDNGLDKVICRGRSQPRWKLPAFLEELAIYHDRPLKGIICMKEELGILFYFSYLECFRHENMLMNGFGNVNSLLFTLFFLHQKDLYTKCSSGKDVMFFNPLQHIPCIKIATSYQSDANVQSLGWPFSKQPIATQQVSFKKSYIIFWTPCSWNASSMHMNSYKHIKPANNSLTFNNALENMLRNSGLNVYVCMMKF